MKDSFGIRLVRRDPLAIAACAVTLLVAFQVGAYGGTGGGLLATLVLFWGAALLGSTIRSAGGSLTTALVLGAIVGAAGAAGDALIGALGACFGLPMLRSSGGAADSCVDGIVGVAGESSAAGIMGAFFVWLGALGTPRKRP